MKIKCLNSEGLFGSEARALRRISQSFRQTWRGYASFELRDRTGTTEIDLVVITHDKVLVVELKDWHGELTRDGDCWALNGESRGRSPVSGTQLKSQRLKSLLTKHYGHSFRFSPWVEPVVVLTGTASKTNLGSDSRWVLNLDEFLTLGGGDAYAQRYGDSPQYLQYPGERPNKKFEVFDEFFDVRNRVIRPGRQRFHNYRIVGPPLFEHPAKLYREFAAEKVDDHNYTGMLRLWDFENRVLDFPTPRERAKVGLREHRVLGYLREHDDCTKDFCLQPLAAPNENEVGIDFAELFELPRRHHRLSEFVYGDGANLTTKERVAFVKILLEHMSRVHAQGVAHWDIGSHTVWLSRTGHILISGFITAHYPELETIHDDRNFVRAGEVKLPEEVLGDSNSTPFRSDVYLLGVAAHLLLYGRLPRANRELGGIFEWSLPPADPFNGELNNWFDSNLSVQASLRSATAREMLDALNDVTPVVKTEAFDATLLQRYITEKVPILAYPPLSGPTDAYRSNVADRTFWVKTRYGTDPATLSTTEQLGLLALLERVARVRDAASDLAPKVIEFGLSHPTRSLYVVQEWREGITLNEQANTCDDSVAESVAATLVDAIARLHKRGLYHGDLKPENILIVHSTEGSPEILLLDLIDVQSLSIAPYNTAYAPAHSIVASPEVRDRFAVCKIVSELLCERTSAKSKRLSSAAVSLLAEDPDVLTLDPLVQALTASAELTPVATFEVGNRNLRDEAFPSDNGKFYVRAEVKRASLYIHITGAGVVLLIEVDPTTKAMKWASLETIPQRTFEWEIRNAAGELTCHIRTIESDSPSADGLLEALWVAPYVQEQLLPETNSIGIGLAIEEDSEQPKSEMNAGRVVELSAGPREPALTPVRDLWRALIDREVDLWPEVELTETARPLTDVRAASEGRSVYEAPYTSIGSPLDYKDEDIVRIFAKGTDGPAAKPLGRLDVANTTPDRLVFEVWRPWNPTKEGDRLVFQSKQDRESYERRRSAVLRILDKDSVIPDLADVFSGRPGLQAERTAPPISDNDLDAYTVLDGAGKTVFRLNSEQREAFRTLFSQSPVCLLQGPPGTGKTAFIGAFVHYLVTKGGAHHVLLAGQSHTAVNNAAEKVRFFAGHLGGNVDIVRLGQEAMISDELLDVHSDGIQERNRALFIAEFVERISSLAAQLGLPVAYVKERAVGERALGGLIDDIVACQDSLKAPDERQCQDPQVQARRRSRLAELLRKDYAIELDDSDVSRERIFRSIDDVLARRHSVQNSNSRNRLTNALKLANDWVGVLRTRRNHYEHFLARTRTIVCGTCVGLGHQDYAIAGATYDWVIIDEAARCDPGELAVTMQAGRRILLVGDHRQLPPQLDDQLVRVVASGLPGVSEMDVRRSDFQRAFESSYGETAGVTLRTQYRMAEPICRLVSDCFYPETPLETGCGASPEAFSLLPAPMNSHVVWFDTSAEKMRERKVKTSFDNEYEAKIVLRILEKLNTTDILLAEESEEGAPVGVICTYAAQKWLILRHLSEAPWASELRNRRLVKVDTVDAYQGRQNQIVLLSLTRNNPNGAQGFVGHTPRINVSLSRAQQRLYIVGALDMWTTYNRNSAMGTVASYLQQRADDSTYCIVPASRLSDDSGRM